MAEITKPVYTVMIINLFLVLGGVQLFDAGVLGTMFDLTGEPGEQTVNGTSAELEDALPKEERSFLQDPVGTTLSILDPLGVVIDFLLILFNIVLAPIALFTSAGLPNLLKALLGVPLTILNVIAITSFIRSGA